MHRNLQLLGIARKAGLLAIGGEAVSAASRTGKARLILSASDVSEGTARRARINAENSRTVYITVPYSKFELGNITGRGSPGTVAFLDTGLAAVFVEGLAETDPERYLDSARLLRKKADAIALRKKQSPRRTMP